MFSQYDKLFFNQKLQYHLNNYIITCKTGNFCYFGYEQQSNGFHSHSSYEFALALNGEGSFNHNSEQFSVKTGDLILADPNTPHEITCSHYHKLTFFYFFLDIKIISSTSICSEEELIVESFLNNHSLYAPHTTKLIEFFQFISTYTNHASRFNVGFYNLFKIFIFECLSELISKNALPTIAPIPQTTLEKALDYIDIHLHQKIFIEDIAQYCSVSCRTLQYTFRKELDLSIIEYVNLHKIKLACHYLLNNFSITDTCNLIGINDISHFNKLFKSFMGLTPGQVQKISTSSTSLGRRL